MVTLKKYTPFLASALLMYALLYLIYPNYQYYIDPDGTSYLTISQRYANGDYTRAINGYWSPWSCWLTAGLIKLGWAAIPASVIINTMAATGYLYISQSFFLRFNMDRMLQWMLNLALVIFLCFAIFWQSFADLWECFFLLSVLRLMLADGFSTKPVLWAATGFIGALAYFAKAYSFPFFILNTAVCGYFIAGGTRKQWLKICAVAVGTMIVVSLPWIFALHTKYGIWTTSTAGTLNTSWYLVGHPHWKQGINLLLPPAYPDSPYYWEDPWFANGETPHFWSSWHLFGLQFLRIGLNLCKLLRSSLELSVFFPVIGILALLSLRNKKWRAYFTGDSKIVVYSFLLFPLGYVLINFESRYLWYMLPLALVLGGNVLRQIEVKYKKLWVVSLAVSLAVFPVWGLVSMYDAGKQEFQLSKLLRENGVKGTFTSNALSGKSTQRMVRLAYFSGNPYFTMPIGQPYGENMWSEIDRYKVNYHVVCMYDGLEDDITHLIPKDKNGHTYSCVMDKHSVSCRNLYSNGCVRISVFKIN